MTSHNQRLRLAPTETVEQRFGSESTLLEHDAFGVIKLSRVQVGGGGETLFGSELRHQQMVAIEIHRADVNRHLGRDWVHERECIVRFSMSEAQWAQHVSSIGIGTGVPITLERAPAPGTKLMSMPDIAARAKRSLHEAEFLAMGHKASQGVRDVQARLAAFAMPGAKAPGKKEIEAMLSELRHAGEQFEGNLAHASNSFSEQMENTVQDAKTEIETFAGNMATRVGFDVLSMGAQAPTLIEIEGHSESHHPAVQAETDTTGED